MSFLTALHAQLRNARLTRRGATHKPEDVPRGAHKSYERMPTIVLPMPKQIPESLASVLERRSSSFTGDATRALPIETLGTLFGLSLSRRPEGFHRMYPSGGALYPVETYLIATNVENAPMHVFHYNPTTHALEVLWKLEQQFMMTNIVPGSDTMPASALIVFTAVWERSSAKYGELAYQHSLIEVGHMSENVLLVSTALGLETRPMAGYNDDAVARALDLDASDEQVIHTITVCMPRRPQ